MSRAPGDNGMGAGGGRVAWPWLLAGAVAIGALIGVLSLYIPEWPSDENTRLRLVIAVLWAALATAALAARAASRGFRVVAGKLVTMCAIGLALLTVYAFRAEFGRLKDGLPAGPVPPRAASPPVAPVPQVEIGHAVSVRVREGGHFVIEARVNGTPIRFIVDTGASDVVLRPDDARRIGLDPNALDYTRRYSTANGVVEGAPVQLDRVTIGSIEVESVRASVTRTEMPGSLLGMSFLGRLSGYEVRDGVLTLRQ